MRYVYGLTAAILIGGATATLTLQPAGAQVAQNEPGAIRAAAPRADAPMSFANLVERLQPAVVNISTRQSVTVRPRRLPPGLEEFFRRFGQEVPQQDAPTTREGQSLGSGFIISADGYIVTNNHVVAPAADDAVIEEIRVTLPDRTEYEAELVGRDPASDLAVLKINADEPLPFVRFGRSEAVRVGDWVVAMGNPFNLGGNTVTAGIVSALHRNIGAGPYDRFIQTDASINSGNSGGPMFDLNGNVVGINTALFSPTGGNVGIGFAIPAEQAVPVIEALRRGDRVQRGYIGVALQEIRESEAAALGIERNRGELISSVTPGGPADRAGIRPGDVVVSVAGQPVNPDQSLAYLVAQQEVGSTIPLEVIRQGRRMRVNIRVAERPSEEELARLGGAQPEEAIGESEDEPQTRGQRSAREGLGVTVQTLTPDIARRLGIEDRTVRGVVISNVDPNSDAARKGLRAGDIILSINQQPTPTPEAAAEAIAEARSAGRDAVLLQVRRGTNPPLFVGIDLTRE